MHWPTDYSITYEINSFSQQLTYRRLLTHNRNVSQNVQGANSHNTTPTHTDSMNYPAINDGLHTLSNIYRKGVNNTPTAI